VATYRQIQERVKSQAGFVPQTCWIADVKAGRGLTSDIAPNRIDPHARVKPCPEGKRRAIEAALDYFGMR